MRHQNKIAKLGRTSSHRKATMAALSTALIKHKRITTTLAKAKALRSYVEPLISRSRTDNTHNRRQVFRYLQDKHAVTELFSGIADKVGDRPGGYTRVVKLGQRAGDSAQMAIIEFVDYNETGDSGRSTGRKRRTRRGRSGGGRSKVAAAASAAVETVKDAAESVADSAEDLAEKAADVAEDAMDKIEDAAEAVVDKVEDAAEAVADKVEDLVDDAKEKLSGDDDSDEEAKQG
ncbi:MAG: 50S ribosomal protein L17 [Rhodothermales bacterium]|nr:50S ribosomal protein L17 [Rhodothermales bacterium]MBO6781396.1 50S ribosomal protein L17 [Rhodothermales bacterium]